jgi:muconolactone delta-isomerase
MARLNRKGIVMEFLVDFHVNVPEGTPEAEVSNRAHAEASAAARLAADGHLVRLWKRHVATGETHALGLYRVDSRTELDALVGALPLYEWMSVTATPLERHPNDPAAAQRSAAGTAAGLEDLLPAPRLTLVYRLDATLGQPLDVGETAHGHRRIVPLTGGTVTGPEISGRLLHGASADWQVLLPDGTALADVRYTLQTDDGSLLYVRSQGVRHGSPEVLARLARGEDVDASEYTFRTSTQIETAVTELAWLNKGVLISVGGRQPAGVMYETYLVE